MITRLTARSFLITLSLIQTADLSHLISLKEVGLGEDVTFDCKLSEKPIYLYWYKQSLGNLLQPVAGVVLDHITMNEQFKDSRFEVLQYESWYSLKISNVSKEDEATFYCGTGAGYSQTFISGTFLAVKDHNQKTSLCEKQSLKTDLIEWGNSVTLKCSLFSKNKETRVQCPPEHSVYWFRTGSEGFHPGIIYTQGNFSDEDERSCSHSLSIIDSSEAGTYYCAVVTCGAILFGEGTKVETGLFSRPKPDPVVIILGGVLACCVTVIVILIIFVKQKKVCEHCKGSLIKY
ncbi:uncharacterized protein LOC121642770 [Melanotaenia boesemani]|uniref:uncharacterized protein LOC121642770 n=1 Tax=Melanotaenia boesemani TaxID=1250792 RepID=UPI001C03F174|nr:uncharacterized protein LOC121642770 [Melanotaenia boesemani]